MYRFEATVDFTRHEALTVITPDRLHDKRPVLFLHGMGESGQQLLEKHEKLIASSGRTWIFPNGPLPWERRRLGRLGYSWYFFLGDQQMLKAGMLEAAEYLKRVIAAAQVLTQIRLPLAALGFSQGGYLGSVAAASDASLYASFACIGGRLKHEFFPKRDFYPPMLQLHGEDDFSVSRELAANAVASAATFGVNATMMTFPNTGHEVSSEMLEAYLAWEDAIV